MKKNAKKLRGDAERAAEWYAHEVCGCVITRRAIRTQFQKVDFFGADVVGKRPGGSHVYIQATAGQHSAVTSRRRKLERIPWHGTDQVLLLQLVTSPDPANARRKIYYFRIHEYTLVPRDDSTAELKRRWGTHENAFKIPREWFKARKEA